MTWVIKTSPTEPDASNRCVVTAPPIWRATPQPGDKVYIWFSETQGGAGLAYRGVIFALSDVAPLSVAVQIEAACQPSTLTKAHLQAEVETGSGSPLAGLAAKLYTHAHNKIAALDATEAQWLDQFFLSPRPGSHGPAGRYAPLAAYLSEQAQPEFSLSFDEIEAVIGVPLPTSAERPQWWANTVAAHTNVQREAWRAAGYDAFLLAGQRQVRFRRTTVGR